jgi:putative iron-regulated protein
MTILKIAPVPIATIILLIACNGCSDPAAELQSNYADIVFASYQDSVHTAVALDEVIDAFVAAPSAAGLEEAKTAWLASREPYLQTEVYRFYDGPIDNPTDGPEGLLNAWPLDESHIDSIIAGSDEITADFLEGQNESPNEDSIAVGYHAIEYLLWGADTDPNGPGSRPHTDYTDAGGDRMGLYLATVSDMLVSHLQGLEMAWMADMSSNYRSEFAGLDSTSAAEKILTGMIILSGFETGGERIQAALSSGDQEDEHSCFSDNTHRDMVQDLQGVLNVWEGSYTSTDGVTTEGGGVHQVVLAEDSELAGRVDSRIRESLTLAQALQPPFDQEIAPGNTEGNARVQALVDSLTAANDGQEAVLMEVFTLLGLSVDIPTE